MFRTKLFWIIFALLFTNINIVEASSPSEIIEAKVFEYQDLKSQINDVKQYLHDYGFIAIRGVPGYLEKKAKYFELSQAFVDLDEKTKEECSPPDSFAKGWSYGIEVFNGKRDSYKGSYYASFSDQAGAEDKNIWPPKEWSRSDDFKKAYTDLAQLIFKTGKEVLPMLNLGFENMSATGRMLYYGATPEQRDDNPNWCGVHRDHGLFTGLIPAMYKKDGKIIKKPSGAGLYIRNQEVRVPDDVIMFQVGEVADMLTNQEIIATDHSVKKAYGGIVRYSFALFINVEDEKRIYAEKVDPQYQSRYKYGMTYKEWGDASYERYKVKK